MQADCLALTNSGKGKQMRNTLIRAESHALQLLGVPVGVTPAGADKSGGNEGEKSLSDAATCFAPLPDVEALPTNGVSRQANITR
jgi:hypothetical protein